MEYLASYEGKSSNFCRSDRISHLSVPLTKRSKEWTSSWLTRWCMEEAAYGSTSVSGLSLNTRYFDMTAVYTTPFWLVTIINIKPMPKHANLTFVWIVRGSTCCNLQLKAAMQLKIVAWISDYCLSKAWIWGINDDEALEYLKKIITDVQSQVKWRK